MCIIHTTAKTEGVWVRDEWLAIFKASRIKSVWLQPPLVLIVYRWDQKKVIPMEN